MTAVWTFSKGAKHQSLRSAEKRELFLKHENNQPNSFITALKERNAM